MLVTRLVGSPALVHDGGLPDADHRVAVDGYAAGLRVLFQAAAVLSVIVVVLQAATGWNGPKDEKEDEEEVRRALAQSDPEYEA